MRDIRSGDHTHELRRAIDGEIGAFKGNVIGDGKIHRFHVTGDDNGSKNGYYVVHFDRRPAGAFGSWKSGIHVKWTAEGTTELTKEEKKELDAKIKAAKEKRAAEQKARQEGAAIRAQSAWEAAEEV